MMIDISEKAKPCPMCGSKRIYMETQTYGKVCCIKIRCGDYGLNGYKNFMVNAKDLEERTIEYWNTKKY